MSDESLNIEFPDLGLTSDDHPVAVGFFAEQQARAGMLQDAIKDSRGDLSAVLIALVQHMGAETAATAVALARIEAVARGTRAPVLRDPE